MKRQVLAGFGLALAMTWTVPVRAQDASCQGGRSFETWLSEFKRDAAAQGISSRAIASALDGVTFDQATVGKDRGGQAVFTQSFVQFAGRMANANRIANGEAKIRANAATFRRIEQEFGVPAGVLTAFWGLETDFGGFLGNGNTIRSVATLAYDCKRADMFRDQLMAILKIVGRGDLTPDQMRGPWAGELGQFQFLPTHYVDFGLDYDGDGRVNLIKSDADALGSAANYIKHLGWQAGQPWLVEVKISPDVPLDQADLTVEHTAEQWTGWGVRRTDGKPISGPASSLHLPQGRHGPAFLAYPNFKNVYLTWNHSLIYSTTAAYMATRLEGARPMSTGDGTPDLDANGVKDLQRLLAAKGHDVGKIDGIVGAGSRAAIKKEQVRLGQPADSYPSTELLQALRAGQ
ncbi:lytic murein transglycosylase [Terrihabitans rhizophilus]|uniref:Lytic murein transglycosylase n=1 Tax=Terrihabitans rhizophilus TaxID=3092662 RepID=A0ABU4RTP1_9HYPH|nr:lytic murein transglycosylase [Terrihabitans sp. PJ23]MDX6807000.1 lytic murein transglycosylase [Terrihabitans sp. PJ23]